MGTAAALGLPARLRIPTTAAKLRIPGATAQQLRLAGAKSVERSRIPAAVSAAALVLRPLLNGSLMRTAPPFASRLAPFVALAFLISSAQAADFRIEDVA